MKKLFHFFILIAISVDMIAQERIPMTLEESGIYTIPCEVNGLKLKFVFDTGAADVHLSLVEAAFMLKNGYIDEDDFLGTGTYSMADGSISENAMVNLKTIKIGNTTIHNVQACVSSKIDASLLLGQSAIQKLGKYSIDGSYLLLYKSDSDNLGFTRDSVIYDVKGKVVASNFTGKGKKVYSDGYVVETKFKNGLEYGKGKWYSTRSDFRYEGEFANGEPNGKGVMHVDGNVYEGNFVNGYFYGQGKIKYKNGMTYSGNFKNNIRDGHGTFTWPSGDVYVGNFVNGYREGYGIYTWSNGEKYEGYHVRGKFEGKGTRFFGDGSKYEGNFTNNEIEGFGTYTWPSGDKYVGDFKEGQRTGYGTYYWKDGSSYKGYWLNGKQDGTGTYYYSSGGTLTGTWKDGNYVNSSSGYSSSLTTYSNNSTSSSSNGYVDNSYNKTRDYLYNNDEYDDEDEDSVALSFSEYDDVNYFIAQVTKDVNLREGPGIDYDIVTIIPRGGYVFLSTSDVGAPFRRVLYIDKNEFGYVSQDYLANFSEVEVDASGNLQIESKNYKTTADIKIENRTNKTATIAIGSITIRDIKPGRYKTMASSPGVMPYVGYDTVEGGYEYSWVFYIKTVTR